MVHFIHQMQYYITFEVSPLAALLRLQAVKQQFKTLVITARKGGGGGGLGGGGGKKTGVIWVY